MLPHSCKTLYNSTAKTRKNPTKSKILGNCTVRTRRFMAQPLPFVIPPEAADPTWCLGGDRRETKSCNSIALKTKVRVTSTSIRQNSLGHSGSFMKNILPMYFRSAITHSDAPSAAPKPQGTSRIVPTQQRPNQLESRNLFLHTLSPTKAVRPSC